jgi:NTE family protein
MSITINGEEKRIGLALSGGGFRAAAFHLGVFRKLQELDLLWKIDLLTCVSGGSIAGAFLALNWGKDDAIDKLERYLGSASIAVSSVIGGVLDPFSGRLDKLAKSYERDLFGKRSLDELKDGPRIYFNSTNMSTGNMFFFVAGGGQDSEMGEHELGVEPAGGFRISRAVAASSAFPPVFPPMKIKDKDYPASRGDYVTLTDGGVYDNLGVNPLFRMKRNRIDYAIVSDGGKPFMIDETPTEAGSIVLKEAIGILMEQVRGLQFKRLELSHAAGQGPKSIWFSIDSREGEVNEGDAVFASSISTNLKKLNAAELGVLGRHAGGLLDSRLKLYVPELVSAGG